MVNAAQDNEDDTLDKSRAARMIWKAEDIRVFRPQAGNKSQIPAGKLPAQFMQIYSQKYGTPEFAEIQAKLVAIAEPLREKWYGKVEAGEMEFEDAQVAALEEAWKQYKMAA